MRTLKFMAACALVMLTTAPLMAQDDKQEGLDDAVNAIAAIDDPIFNQYVNLDELDYAWTYLDSAALADIGTKLAKAERILFRNHPGVSSKDILKIAVRTASVNGDTKTLEKLEEFAKETDNGEMVDQIKMAKQLAGTSRSVAPQLSLDDVSLGAFIAYKQAQLDLKAALVIGDIKLMKELQERVNEYVEKEPAIWTKLAGQVNEQAKTMETLGAPSRGGPDDMSGATNALNMLSGASRAVFMGPGGGGVIPGSLARFGGGGGGGYGGGYSGATSNFNYQHGMRVQNPRAAVMGGLLGGLAQGLQAQNPQRNAVAAGVLGGLGQGFGAASQPTFFGSGSSSQTNFGGGFGGVGN